MLRKPRTPRVDPVAIRAWYDALPEFRRETYASDHAVRLWSLLGGAAIDHRLDLFGLPFVEFRGGTGHAEQRGAFATATTDAFDGYGWRCYLSWPFGGHTLSRWLYLRAADLRRSDLRVHGHALRHAIEAHCSPDHLRLVLPGEWAARVLMESQP